VEAKETALLDLEPEEPEEVPVLPGPTEDNASQGSTLSGAWGGNDSETANISEVEDLVMVAESRFTDSEGSQDLAGLRDNANWSTAPEAANVSKGNLDVTATGNLTHTQKLNLRSAPIKPPSINSDSSSESSADSFESAATQILNTTKEALQRLKKGGLRGQPSCPGHNPKTCPSPPMLPVAEEEEVMDVNALPVPNAPNGDADNGNNNPAPSANGAVAGPSRGGSSSGARGSRGGRSRGRGGSSPSSHGSYSDAAAATKIFLIHV
jgi:hypothetical protein